MQTMTWLKFNRCEDDANRVASLCCSVCQEFDYRLRGLRNYSAAFVTGASNLRCSNFKDQSKTDMHTKAMSLYREKTARSSVMESAPIIRALNTYTIAREGIAFAKMNTLCDLLETQGVNLGEGYKTNMACSTFVDLRLSFCKAMQSRKFFSIHMDGSTDAGNVEEELFLCTYLDITGSDGTIHVRNNFFVCKTA